MTDEGKVAIIYLIAGLLIGFAVGLLLTSA